MREKIEGIGCYLSCMVLFNLIYFLSVLSKSDICLKGIKQLDMPILVTLIVSLVLVIFGVVFTIYIVRLDDSENNTITTGKKFEVITVCDKTAENYLTNFSVIVLTGIALPAQPDWLMFCVYLLIETVIGIVYVKKNLFYMNPVLTLMSYSIYECTGREGVTKNALDGNYIFMTKNMVIKEKQDIKYKNINSRIIWLKK